MTGSQPARFFGGISKESESNFLDTLRSEVVGGGLLLTAAALALIWANSPIADSYFSVRDTTFGPGALGFNLTLGQWATDGLLAIFFFVVGLELKREIVAGDLRRPATAIVPIIAAVGGIVVPAGIYVVLNVTSAGGDLTGWAVPTATDIAFAVSILAVVGSKLPTALRAFMLTLAVIDDLIAIIIIAAFYTDSLALLWLAAALVPIVIFALLVRRGISNPLILIPLGVLAWGCMHASGIHSTIAGVALGFTVPALAKKKNTPSLAERFEHACRPVSAAIAVPVFALFAAGVQLNGEALQAAAADPIAQGVALGLVLGKPIGVLLATWLLATFTRAKLAEGLTWADVGALGAVAGIGFTVSLLIGELAFGADSASDDHVKAAVLLGSTTAAIIGAALLGLRNRRYKKLSTTR